MAAKRKLLIISFSNISADARVLKQVALFSAQYDLYTCGYGPKAAGAVEHFEIPESEQSWQYSRLALIFRQYRRAYWTNPAVSAAKALLVGSTFEGIFANEVDAVGLALSLNPSNGVHADLHEYAPRQKEESPRWRWFVAPFIRWMCRRFITKAVSVTTVGEGIAQEYQREFGFTAAVVTNAAPYSSLAPTDVEYPLKLVHSGACLRGRGIVEILAAVERTTTDVQLDLYLTPNDPGYLKEIADLTVLSSRSRLNAPVPYIELAGTLNSSDVGVHVLPPINFNNAWALPNKFFDYVQARLGIVIGPSPEMARILEERKLGAVAESFTVESLVSVLDNLSKESVTEWKSAAHEVSRELSSESQVLIWDQAMLALFANR